MENNIFKRMQKLAGLINEDMSSSKPRYFISIIFRGQDDEIGSYKGISASTQEEFEQKLEDIYGGGPSDSDTSNGLAQIKKYPDDDYWTFYEVNSKEEMEKWEQKSKNWYDNSDFSEEKELESIAKKGVPFNQIKF